jgi:hypothetical protein
VRFEYEEYNVLGYDDMLMGTNVSEEPVLSFFRVEEILQPRRWR